MTFFWAENFDSMPKIPKISKVKLWRGAATTKLLKPRIIAAVVSTTTTTMTAATAF